MRVLFLAAAATLFALSACELLLRAFGIPDDTPWFQVFRGPDFSLMCFDSNESGSLDIDLNDASQRVRDASRFEDDEFAKHWRTTPYCVEVRFNSLGYRDSEFAPKRAGVRRIVVVGDSLTYGHGLPESASYPRQLESLLAARPGAEPTEVLNLGMGAYELDRIAKVASYALRVLAPDVLVYGYFMNDPGWNGDVGRPATHNTVRQSGTRFEIGPPPVEGLHVTSLVRRAAQRRAAADEFFAWHERLHAPDYWAPSGRLIERMAERARAQGVRFVLLLLPVIWDLADHPLREVHDRIAAFARQREIETVDALPALSVFEADDLILHPRDRHPNTTYSRIVAEQLADVLALPAQKAAGPSGTPAEELR